LPGAEAWSTDGAGPGAPGALCIHGFTGNPTSMRPVAEAFAAAGFAVELPRLPGHGTTVDEMLTTGWEDWSAEAEAAYQRVAARASKVVVAGLSMGGTLTVWLAENHPEIAGIVAINAAVAPQQPEVVEMVKGMVGEGTKVMPGIGSDIAKPGVVESAYADTPLEPLLSLIGAVEDIGERLGDIACPVLIMTSPQDHVVDPAASDLLAAKVKGPVERVTLGRSYHVATVDFDAELIQQTAVEFGKRVTT
ncbi:MAG TPA: alpha/beta fold hydrolase, partial [Acidimicrobiales bacterium]|nr:alpha/beta fold hydrolase [Acidimicrobiales bacterium]